MDLNPNSYDYYNCARIAYGVYLEDELERIDDEETERRASRLEALENDELVEEVFEAFGELLDNSESESHVKKMVNKLMKAFILRDKEELAKPIESLLSDLTYKDDDIVRSYLMK